MSNINKILNGLNGVKSTGKNKWVAKCCAHEDRSPSLAIKELDDGRILLHCFAGCGVDEIVVSLGLDIGDLFPDKLTSHKSERHPFSANDILKLLLHEMTVVSIAAQQIGQGKPLSSNDVIRVELARHRIEEAARYVNI